MRAAEHVVELKGHEWHPEVQRTYGVFVCITEHLYDLAEISGAVYLRDTVPLTLTWERLIKMRNSLPISCGCLTN